MKKLFLSDDANKNLTELFIGLGYKVCLVKTTGIVADPVSDHPDMFMCKMGTAPDSDIVMWPGLFRNDTIIDAGPMLCPKYPHDIPYNSACTGRYLIHYLKYTAPEILKKAKELGMIMVDVKQGYAKCSTVIVDENSIITYDQGIASACRAAGLDVLTVMPGHVMLPGYDTGFIGGASGRVGDTIYFNGDLSVHPDFDNIREFIESHGLKLWWTKDWPLTDIGSVICE